MAGKKARRKVAGQGRGAAAGSRRKVARQLRVRRDSTDFRDLIYEPSLVQIERQLLPDPKQLQILDQGTEGACTGYGLAASINRLLQMRDREAAARVSPHMLYDMAKRHDQWPGEDYEGSSARGAMVGWYKHGVCLEADWIADKPEAKSYLTAKALDSARLHPLGVYYRVLPKRVDLHAALSEVGVVFASADTHRDWDAITAGVIPYKSADKPDGGHAFAIVGYTEEGLLIQNSWGRSWGGVKLGGKTFPGCALWSYDDFQANVWDLWVARLALPVASVAALGGANGRLANARRGAPTRKAPPRATIRDEFIHIDDGKLNGKGDYYSSASEVVDSIQTAVNGGAKHLALFAHGGLNSVDTAAARTAAWQPMFARYGIRPISFIWETGLIAEVKDLILPKEPGVSERAGGVFSEARDMALELVLKPAGYPLWHEMIADAERAFAPNGAGTWVVRELVQALGAAKNPPAVHLVGHSAGSVWHAHLLQAWQEAGGSPIADLTLFAPACTHDLFESHVRPRLLDKSLGHFHHFLLDDRREQDDNVVLYRKSLLYLVSRAFQDKDRVVPILGMERYLEKSRALRGLEKKSTHYTPVTHPLLTQSASHGGFDNDAATLDSMLAIILEGTPGKAPKSRVREGELRGY